MRVKIYGKVEDPAVAVVGSWDPLLPAHHLGWGSCFYFSYASRLEASMSISVAWQPIKDQIDAARGKRAILQDKRSSATPAEKPAIIRQIKALNEQIAALQT